MTCGGRGGERCFALMSEANSSFRRVRLHRSYFEPLFRQKQKSTTRVLFVFGADYGARTRHLDLGKVALYQMS